jgi:hypothetical protein
LARLRLASCIVNSFLMQRQCGCLVSSKKKRIQGRRSVTIPRVCLPPFVLEFFLVWKGTRRGMEVTWFSVFGNCRTAFVTAFLVSGA